MALVIDRNKGEAIVIVMPDGQTFDIVVKSISNRVVALVFNAPQEVTILRKELIEKLREKQNGS